MKTTHLFRSAAGIPETGRTKPRIPFKVFIAYGDLPAARKAMNTIVEVLSVASRRFAFEPMFWRFDQLDGANWRERAIGDAGNASVVVLATSATGSLPNTVERWVSDFLNHQRGTRTTLVALNGPTDAWTITLEESRSPQATSEAEAA